MLSSADLEIRTLEDFLFLFSSAFFSPKSFENLLGYHRIMQGFCRPYWICSISLFNLYFGGNKLSIQLSCFLRIENRRTYSWKPELKNEETRTWKKWEKEKNVYLWSIFKWSVSDGYYSGNWEWRNGYPISSEAYGEGWGVESYTVKVEGSSRKTRWKSIWKERTTLNQQRRFSLRPRTF